MDEPADDLDELVSNLAQVAARVEEAEQPPAVAGPSRHDHGVMAFVRHQRDRGEEAARQASDWLEDRRQHNVLVDLAYGLYERDKASAGTVLGSAIAFRLFLFFIPLLLFVVGIAGFLSNHIDAKSVSDSASVTGALRGQIESALNQPGSTRWLATLSGLFGMLAAGRSLTKALVASSALSWQVSLRRKATVKIVGGVVGLVVTLTLMSALLNRVRDRLGVGVASVSFLIVAVVYLVLWLLLSTLLPRGTTDPGALLPGAALFAVTLATLQAVSQLYLPSRMSHASALYGSVGIAIATLGWFFFIGRVIVFSSTLNAVVYERVGSLSQFVFSLPLLRVLPRRWPRIGTFFNLEHEPGRAGGPEPELEDPAR